MSYIDHYKTRLHAEGATPGEAYASATINVINESFSNAPNYRNIPVDSVLTDVRVLDVKSSQQGNQILSFIKELLFRPNTVRRRGSYADLEGQKWLLFDYIAGITPKAVIRLCNEELTIQTGSTQVLIGTDAMNRPVYDTHPTYTSYPCVVDSKVQNPYDNLNAAISLPEGSISVIIPYTSQVAENMQFEMWSYDYKIIGVNNQYVINNEGPMIITAQRVVK